MTTRSRISSGVRTLCGDAADEPLLAGLPEHVIYEVITDVESGMLIDLNLSDQNRRVQSKTISLQPNGYDFALNASTFSVPSFAQLQFSPTDTWRDPVDIINLSSIDDAGIQGRTAVAFYGTPLRARLSWIPQSGENQSLTFWFDKTIDGDGDLADEPAIEDAYTVHLKLQAVAQCMELMKQAVGPTLAARILKGEQQWRQYVRRNGQQGAIKKPSSHPRAGQHAVRFQRPGGGPL